MGRKKKHRPPKISDQQWDDLHEAAEAVSDVPKNPESPESAEDGMSFLEMLAKDPNLTEKAAEKATYRTATPRRLPARHAATKKKAKKQKPSGPTLRLDLHGLTLEEARSAVDGEMRRLIEDGSIRSCTLRVITGKGRSSGPGGGVLAQHMHSYVYQKFSSWIQLLGPCPTAVLDDDGVPTKGHFDVELSV